MYFDSFIVLIFALAGALLFLARRAGRAAAARPDASSVATLVVTGVFTAALALLFPWALVLRNCLDDRGPAQSLGIGAFALLEGGLFVGILLLGAWHARKSI